MRKKSSDKECRAVPLSAKEPVPVGKVPWRELDKVVLSYPHRYRGIRLETLGFLASLRLWDNNAHWETVGCEDRYSALLITRTFNERSIFLGSDFRIYHNRGHFSVCKKYTGKES